MNLKPLLESEEAMTLIDVILDGERLPSSPEDLLIVEEVVGKAIAFTSFLIEYKYKLHLENPKRKDLSQMYAFLIKLDEKLGTHNTITTPVSIN